jgi:hypothetical protein
VNNGEKNQSRMFRVKNCSSLAITDRFIDPARFIQESIRIELVEM